jgi:mono/diheme cytochrome c family protein
MRSKLLPLIAVVGCHHETRSTTVVEATPPPAATETQAGTARLERGAYVANVAGCLVCHTPLTAAGSSDMSRLGAGGFEDKIPGLGVWRGPNITPDRASGIGAWTDDQIANAIRTGVRPDGKRLAPIMPYPFYNKMTDGDVRALVIYLRALTPVDNPVPRSDLKMEPVIVAPPHDNVDPMGDLGGHGEYLATMMHCAACHTPQTGAFAGQPYAGGTIFTLKGGRTVIAPNITSDPATGLGNWSNKDVAMTIQTMIDPNGRTIEPPMAMYRDAWSRLNDKDLQALAAFVKAIPPVIHDVSHEAPHQVGAR